GGPALARIARWTGSGWVALGNGIHLPPANNYGVYSMTSFDDGTGPQLYVGGFFDHVDGVAIVAPYLARWNGSVWSALPGTQLDGVPSALETFDDGTGVHLYVGGDFDVGGVRGVVRWTGASFEPIAPAFSDNVSALAAIDDGTGVRLYAGTASG